jgi:glycerate 2-kinase
MLYEAATFAVDPANCLTTHLPTPPDTGRIYIFAAGDSAYAMMDGVERHYLSSGIVQNNRISGVGIGYHRNNSKKTLSKFIHRGVLKIDDDNSVMAVERTLSLAKEVTRQDLVIVLLSLGASDCWTAPIEGLSLATKQRVTLGLLQGGCSFQELKIVRNHLSRIKGGRLAEAVHPAAVTTLYMSNQSSLEDVSLIGCGPTDPDPTTQGDAKAIIARYYPRPGAEVLNVLNNSRYETPKENNNAFANIRRSIVLTSEKAFDAAERMARGFGYNCIFLRESIDGDAVEVGRAHAAIALEVKKTGQPTIILAGSRFKKKVRPNGNPNEDYAFAAATALHGASGISILSAAMDGKDWLESRNINSPGMGAGAFCDETTLARAKSLGLDLHDNSLAIFQRLGDQFFVAASYVNVGDFQAIVVEGS